MDLLIMHMTDLHIKEKRDLDILLLRADSIVGVLSNHITNLSCTTILFCITGDLVFSGKKSQYDLVSIFLRKILNETRKRFPGIVINIIFVPGNHDCDFAISNSVRNMILSSSDLDMFDVNQLEQCTSIQSSFFDFVSEWTGIEKVISCQKNKLLSVNKLILEKENMSLLIHCINTSWCSSLNEVKGTMKIGFKIDELKKSENSIVITLLHHDAEWLDWDSKEFWNEYHRKFSDIILVGHDHSAEYIKKVNYDESSNYYIRGNQLYGAENPEQSGFNILKLDILKMQECFFSYNWDNHKNYYINIIDTGKRPFIKNKFKNSSIELKREIRDFIEKLDTDLPSIFKKDIRFSDIFG